MYKHLLLFFVHLCFGASLFVAGGGNAQARELYDFEIVIQKDGVDKFYNQAIFYPIMQGVKATITKDGKDIQLKYSGLSITESSKGQLTSHTFAYVTQDNKMIIDAYRNECGNLEIHTVWPPEKKTYTVNSESNCTLSMTITKVK